METIYHSKKNGIASKLIWIIIPLSLVLILVGEINIFAFTLDAIIAIIITSLTSAMLMWIWFSTRYVISKSQLKIYCGPMNKVVNLDSIVGVNMTSSPISAPALSLDRIRIVYNKHQEVFISPKNKEQFLAELKSHLVAQPSL